MFDIDTWWCILLLSSLSWVFYAYYVVLLRSGDSRGFGFLTLERDEDADAAIRALDETEWNGRIILVEKSKTWEGMKLSFITALFSWLIFVFQVSSAHHIVLQNLSHIKYTSEKKAFFSSFFWCSPYFYITSMDQCFPHFISFVEIKWVKDSNKPVGLPTRNQLVWISLNMNVNKLIRFNVSTYFKRLTTLICC